VSCLADAPLNQHFEKELTPKQLLATLTSTCFASVHLHHSRRKRCSCPPCPALPPMIVSALAPRSASLTALYNLPLVEPWVEPPPHDPGLGLTALTRLRALTLRQTWEELAELRAAELPPSLEDLKLVDVVEHPRHVERVWEDLPLFVAFDTFQNLRQITLADYWCLKLRWHPALRPPSLEVCAPSPLGPVS